MPRYAGQNLAAINPEFRKANNLDSSGKKNTRYTYGKNVLIAAGKPMAGGLCLRLLPVLEDAQVPGTERNFVNFREGPNNDVFGDWGRLMTCANWVGNPGVCFVIHDGNPERNLYDSPYMVLRNVAYKHKDTPGIGKLFLELIDKQRILDSHHGSLPKADKILFVSASTVYVNDSGQVVLGAFAGEDRKDAKVIGLKFSAAQSLYNILNVRNESDTDFVSGDLLSLGPAKLITLLPESFSSGTPNLSAISTQGPVGFQCPKYARGDKNAVYVVGKPEKPSSMTHFAIMHDTYNGQEITLEPYVDTLLTDTQTWEDRVYVPSYEEQAEFMAPAFPREALEFAWREHPEYIRAISRGTTTSYPTGPDDSDDEGSSDGMAAAFSRRPSPAAVNSTPPAPKDPPAPWDPLPEAELTPEESAGVADIFSSAAPTTTAPSVPAGAASAPPPPPVAAKPATPSSSSDILARARARAAASNR